MDNLQTPLLVITLLLYVVAFLTYFITFIYAKMAY